MPKIFLTGSGISKGYVTGSGYLNNPVRTIVRDRDNRAGTYPTIHRMNRKDNTGILSNTVFDDTKTVKFGNVIKDNFTILHRLHSPSAEASTIASNIDHVGDGFACITWTQKITMKRM